MGRVGLKVRSFHFSFMCSTFVLPFCVSLFSLPSMFFFLCSYKANANDHTTHRYSLEHLDGYQDNVVLAPLLRKERVPRVSQARLAKLGYYPSRPATLFTTTRHHPTPNSPCFTHPTVQALSSSRRKPARQYSHRRRMAQRKKQDTCLVDCKAFVVHHDQHDGWETDTAGQDMDTGYSCRRTWT